MKKKKNQVQRNTKSAVLFLYYVLYPCTSVQSGKASLRSVSPKATQGVRGKYAKRLHIFASFFLKSSNENRIATRREREEKRVVLRNRHARIDEGVTVEQCRLDVVVVIVTSVGADGMGMCIRCNAMIMATGPCYTCIAMTSNYSCNNRF